MNTSTGSASTGLYGRLAELFIYPDAGYPDRVLAIQRELEERYPKAADALHGFTNLATGISQIEMEELYTRSFDVQAITTLDIGYVLFGDDYKRGALLVNLNRELKDAGIDPGHELADHLPNVLRLIDGMADTELRQELVDRVVGPALRKIIGEFRKEKVEAKNEIYRKHHRTLIDRPERRGRIYRFPLTALNIVLESDFGIGAKEVSRQSSDFLKSIGTEIAVEGE